ncbi:reverse transcriptase [Gossypium australe]|uniref:Reverse transcriptase n=1 Tax=Gossypium australe TaxID=47621 RepID=A0A5B6WDX1_9ROSI|nr:reverse transcriptase [Gossypium australe]
MSLELVSESKGTVRLIRDRLKVASDGQKSYLDLKRRDIEFSMGDQVFLKVSQWKKVLRFKCLNNLVAYQLELPLELDHIDDVFHVRSDLTFEKKPAQILDREVKVLKRKTIPLGKNKR